MFAFYSLSFVVVSLLHLYHLLSPLSLYLPHTFIISIIFPSTPSSSSCPSYDLYILLPILHFFYSVQFFSYFTMDGYLSHEVVLYIADFIWDPDTLAALRLVNRSWSQAAAKRMENMKEILYMDWCEKTQKTPMEILSQYRAMAPECRGLVVKAPYCECHHMQVCKNCPLPMI